MLVHKIRGSPSIMHPLPTRPSLGQTPATLFVEPSRNPLFQAISNFIWSRIFIIGFTFCIGYTVYRTIIYPLYLSPLRHIPGPPLFSLPSSSSSRWTRWNPLNYLLAPIYGQFPAIINGESGIPQRAWCKQYGPVIRVVGPVGIERVIFLSPEALEPIMVKNWTEYPRPEFARETFSVVTGDGLLKAEKAEHKQMRKLMNPAFALSNFTSQMDKFHEAIDSLCRIFTGQIISARNPSGGVVLPIHEWTSKIALDILCTTSFSYDPDSLHNPHNILTTTYERLLPIQTGRTLAWAFGSYLVAPWFVKFTRTMFAWRIRKVIGLIPRIGDLSIVLEMMHVLRRISKEMLEEKSIELHSAELEQDRKKDVLSLLVKARKESLESDPTGCGLSDEVMEGQMLTLLITGHETVSSGMAWTLYLLALNKSAQDKLREEVTPILASDPQPEYRTLSQLQWLNCVVMESLRVLPPAPMTMRIAEKTDFIDGVFIPEGTIIYVPIRVINTWQGIWGPDGEEFRPERWLNLPENYHPQYSSMSFGIGPHACIGKSLAIVEMKTVIASLIANFEFDLAYEGQVPVTSAAATMRPKDNMPLRVRRVGRKSL